MQHPSEDSIFPPGLPGLTPLWTLVLAVLSDREQSSRQVRDALALHGVAMEMPLVYRLLGRIEQSGYISGRYLYYGTVDGRQIRERHYLPTPLGLSEWKRTISFYDALRPPADEPCPERLDESLGAGES